MARHRVGPPLPVYKPATEAFIRNEDEEAIIEAKIQFYESVAGIRFPHQDPAKRLIQLVRNPVFADYVCQNADQTKEARELVIAAALKANLLNQIFDSQKEQIISEMKDVCLRRDERNRAAKQAGVRVAVTRAASSGGTSHRGPSVPLSKAKRRDAARSQSKANLFAAAVCGYCHQSFATPKDKPQAYCSKKCEHLDRGDLDVLPGLPPERNLPGWKEEGIAAPVGPAHEAWMATLKSAGHKRQVCAYCGMGFYSDRIQKFCSKDCVKAANE